MSPPRNITSAPVILRERGSAKAIPMRPDGFGALRTRIETYRAAVDSSPVLLGREQEHFADHAHTIAGAIARRRGAAEPDGDAATLAAVALALYQRALRRWLDGPRTRELGDLVDEEFRRLHRLVG